MTTITAYHGTSADYGGFPHPVPQTDVYGFYGIFLADSLSDAFAFAELSPDDYHGDPRVYVAELDMSDALDMSDSDGETWDLVDVAMDSDARVVILPDLSGVCRRELLVKDKDAIVWHSDPLRR